MGFEAIGADFANGMRRYGLARALSLVLYPLILLACMPVIWARTLWNCRVLLRGDWACCNRFSPSKGLNSLYYLTDLLELERRGRFGVSPVLGTGSTPMNGLWYAPSPGYRLYRSLGAAGLVVAGFFWWGSHAAYLGVAHWTWVMGIMVLLLLSSSLYGSIFFLQNYNLYGWMLLPVGLYALGSGQYGLAAVSFLGVALSSFTAILFMSVGCLALAFAEMSPWPLAALAPAWLVYAVLIAPSVMQGQLMSCMGSVAKLIGVTKSGAKYPRRLRFGLQQAILFGLWGQYAVVHVALSGQIPVLYIAGFAVCVVNYTVVRLGDGSSALLFMASLATQAAMTSPVYSPWLLCGYWLAVSPIPFTVGLPESSLWTPKVHTPYSVSPVLKGLEEFFAPVSDGASVLVCYEDPEGEYGRIFDGQRHLNEASVHVCARRSICLMPNCWAIKENNTENSRGFWGRTPAEVAANLGAWDAGYAVVYSRTGVAPGKEWAEAGFAVRSALDWMELSENLPEKVRTSGPLQWWLLEKNG